MPLQIKVSQNFLCSYWEKSTRTNRSDKIINSLKPSNLFETVVGGNGDDRKWQFAGLI